MRTTLRLLFIVVGVMIPLAANGAPPQNKGAANQKQKPNQNQNQQQNVQQQQNQNGAILTAQAIQYSVQQLMALDKNQSGGVEGNEVVNAQVQRLCQVADTDQNGSVTATEFTSALTTVATSTVTVGGNSTAAVLNAAGCAPGNNQTNTTGATNSTNTRGGLQGQGIQVMPGAGMMGQGGGPGMMRGPGGQGGGPSGGMQRGPGGGAARR
jgi:type II secretory pathway pseudopilin PulG